MIRVFFWLKGANPLRDRGPWWWREFHDTTINDYFLSAEAQCVACERALTPLCHEIQRETPTTYTHGLPVDWRADAG